MKKFGLLLILLSNISYSQVWINELSYDMTGGDTDDFIEIVAPVGTNMNQYGILLANGSGDISYAYVQLTGTISNANSNNGFGFFLLTTAQSSSITVPLGITFQNVTSNGFAAIQNGDPDGVLLLNHSTGATIHGIWYKETGVAPTEIIRNSTGTPPGSGPYSMLGVDVTSIGEASTSSAGGSISMSGISNSGTWQVTTSGTPGSMNTNQTALPVELTSFSASVVGNAVHLNWRTETEVNNYGFEVERQAHTSTPLSVTGWEKIGFVNGNGNSNSPKSYYYEDKNITAGKYSYRLKQIDNDGQFEYSKIIEVNFGAPKKFELSQNYPNPFNPVTTIRFNLPEAANVKLTVFNILGQELKTLINEFEESGVHTINFDASELNSGMYIYKIEAGSFVQTRKMTLVK